MKYLLMLFFCTGIVFCKAQDFREDFLTVYNNYHNLDYYTQEVIVSSYASKKDKVPIHQQIGKIIKGKGTYYSRLEEQETIVDGKNFLFINHREKRIVYTQDEKVNTEQFAQYYQQGLDSIDSDYITHIKTDGIYKIYQIQNPKDLIKKTDLVLNMKNKMIEEITYYYQSTGEYESTLYKTVIKYNLKNTTKPSLKSFNWKKYVHIKNNRAVLNSEYATFNLTQPKKEKFNWDELPK